MARGAVAVLALIGLAQPALAQRAASPLAQVGGVPLSAVLEVAKPYPNLQSQVKLRLIATGLTRDKVTCSAQRLDTRWPQLRDTRIAPYTCNIGRRTLTLLSEVTYYDKAGYKLKPNDPALMVNAARLTETRLTWSWK
jgi:hypothetical protein